MRTLVVVMILLRAEEETSDRLLGRVSLRVRPSIGKIDRATRA